MKLSEMNDTGRIDDNQKKLIFGLIVSPSNKDVDRIANGNYPQLPQILFL